MSFCLDLKTPASLRMPDGTRSERTDVWLSLIPTLFQSVQAALDSRESFDFAGLRCAFETWQSFFGPNDIKRSQWEAAGRLLWCAEHAHLVSGVAPDQMAHLFNNSPEQINNNHAGWIWNCTCLLKRLKGSEVSVSIPVALSDENPMAPGTVASLVLDLLKPGTGQIFHHPADSIVASTSDDFSDSMLEAWSAARHQLADKSNANNCDGRWRLRFCEGHPVPRITGPSAGGAATAGWYHLRNGTIYDEGVIVLLQVSRGMLLEVSGIEAKVRAVTRANKTGHRIDTIVVAGEKNKYLANLTLEKLEISNIRVININARST